MRSRISSEPDGVTPWPRGQNLLVQAMERVASRLVVFRDLAKSFFFEVVLSQHLCPRCGGRLRMTGPSQAACACRLVLDPTAEFQRSPCCGARLEKRVYHYACRECGAVVASRYLFDERVFDTGYFRDRMRESRAKKSGRREALRALLASARSEALSLSGLPGLDETPGLMEALREFVPVAGQPVPHLEPEDIFRLEDYRAAVRRCLAEACVRFRAIEPVSLHPRRDVARRFVAVLHMAQEREVDLRQMENDVLVVRHEVDAEG
jgi:hypothetical protein